VLTSADMCGIIILEEVFMPENKKIKQIPLLINSVIFFILTTALITFTVLYVVTAIKGTNLLDPSTPVDAPTAIIYGLLFFVTAALYLWSSLYMLGRSLYTSVQLRVSYRKMATICFLTAYVSVFAIISATSIISNNALLGGGMLAFGILNALNIVAIISHMFVMYSQAKKEIREQKLLGKKKRK